MYMRLSSVMFPILLIALIGAVVWGYQEHQEKNSVLIKAENQYQRAFHDLSYHMNQLHDQLGNTLAANSKSQDFHRKSMVQVWKLTSQAQNEINQLPLTLLPFNDTEEFLSKIANFSYQVSMRDLNKNPLTSQEMKVLSTLYKHSEEVSKDLGNVQHKVLSKNLRWMDVESAMASEEKMQDNTIIDGFKTVNKKVGAYSDVDWGPTAADLYQSNSYQALSGEPLSPDEIRKKAADFMGVKQTSGIKVVENSKNPKYASYSVTLQDPSNGHPVQLDFTKKGGNLLYLLNSRSVGGNVISMNEARESAADFLQNHGFQSMMPVSFDLYNHVASIMFAKSENGMIIYPDKVTVRVAMDDGEVTGLQATDYLFSNPGSKHRQLAPPKISEADARKSLNAKFTVTGHAVALIRTDGGREVVCHEFQGKMNQIPYRIYVNGITGQEEKVERLRPVQAHAG